MRTGTLIAVITASLIAIGVVLGSAITSRQRGIASNFQSITYTRNVDHGQLRIFGECSLGQQIIIYSAGKVEISWFVQRADHHGCVRAIDFQPNGDDQKQWDEPVIARQARVLGTSELRALLDRLDDLRWTPDWQSDGATPTSITTGCDRGFTDAFAERYLFVELAEPRYALLAVYGDQARSSDGPGCVASEIANAATLDAAVSPLVPRLPARYHLPPAVAERLRRAP